MKSFTEQEAERLFKQVQADAAEFYTNLPGTTDTLRYTDNQRRAWKHAVLLAIERAQEQPSKKSRMFDWLIGQFTATGRHISGLRYFRCIATLPPAQTALEAVEAGYERAEGAQGEGEGEDE